MSTQMYTDLIVQELIGAASEVSKPTIFSLPLVGTLSGSVVIVDAIPEPIPYSVFKFKVDDRSTEKPEYKDGDRLFIVPTNDGNQLVITGKLI